MARRLTAALVLLCLCLSAQAQFHNVSDYTRFVPATMHMGLGLVGVPANHAFVDRAIENVIAYSVSLSTGYLLKYTVHRVRPDGSDDRSFPSGHTTFAFTGAELTRMDYGWGWGGGAYAVAIYTGAERVWLKRHWVTDVLAGAGIGILSAHVGGWLLEPVKNLFGIPTIEWDGLGKKTQVAIAPGIDPFTNSYTASIAVVF